MHKGARLGLVVFKAQPRTALPHQRFPCGVLGVAKAMFPKAVTQLSTPPFPCPLVAPVAAE